MALARNSNFRRERRDPLVCRTIPNLKIKLPWTRRKLNRNFPAQLLIGQLCFRQSSGIQKFKLIRREFVIGHNGIRARTEMVETVFASFVCCSLRKHHAQINSERPRVNFYSRRGPSLLVGNDSVKDSVALKVLNRALCCRIRRRHKDEDCGGKDKCNARPPSVRRTHISPLHFKSRGCRWRRDGFRALPRRGLSENARRSPAPRTLCRYRDSPRRKAEEMEW